MYYANLFYLVFDLQSKVENHQLPEDEMVGLQRIFLDQFELWGILVDDYTVITKVFYDIFLGLLIASFYLYSPNGRGGGVESLTLKDGQALVLNCSVASKSFKTSAYFQKQFVQIDEIYGQKLLAIYLMHLRPKVICRMLNELMYNPYYNV